jgi:surfactin synthase thioesterase subunit
MASLVDEVELLLREELASMTRKRYAFAGCSMGAVVALALIERLVAKGLPGPCHLIVCAARPPLSRPESPRLSALDDEGLRRLSLGLDARLAADPAYRRFLDRGLPLLRNDLEVLESYSPRSGLQAPCPVSAFGGIDDPLAPPEVMAGWSTFAGGGFRCRAVPEGHFFFLLEQGAQRRALVQELGRVFLSCGGGEGEDGGPLCGAREPRARHGQGSAQRLECINDINIINNIHDIDDTMMPREPPSESAAGESRASPEVSCHDHSGQA